MTEAIAELEVRGIDGPDQPWRRNVRIRSVGYRVPLKGELYITGDRGHSIGRSNGRCEYPSFIFQEV